MKTSLFHKSVGTALTLVAVCTPAFAFAQNAGTGTYYLNDGSGNCALVACGPNGCTIIDVFPCPREVNPNG